MKQWEVERIKEIVGNILQFWSYDLIDVHDGNGRRMGMSVKTFLEALDRELK